MNTPYCLLWSELKHSIKMSVEKRGRYSKVHYTTEQLETLRCVLETMSFMEEPYEAQNNGHRGD